MLAIQDEIATQIAGRLRWRLTSDERELMTKRYTKSAEAYDWYLKGQYFYARLTEPDLDGSIAHYQQAIAIDPRYALAYVGLADRTSSDKKYVSPYFLALVHLGLQDDDGVFTALEAAYQERHPYLIFLNVEPVLDRVRTDQRFVALKKRVGLTP